MFRGGGVLLIFQRREQFMRGDDHEGIVKTKVVKGDDVGLFFFVFLGDAARFLRVFGRCYRGFGCLKFMVFLGG